MSPHETLLVGFRLRIQETHGQVTDSTMTKYSTVVPFTERR